MPKHNSLRTTNRAQVKGLDEIHISHIRPQVQTFERHLDDVKITLFGPRVEGGYILRIEGKPNGQSQNIKGHVELNIKKGDLHKVLSEQKLYDDIAAMKLAHFVGYIGENHARKAAEAGDLLSKGYIKNRGKTAVSFLSTFKGDKKIVPGSVFSLQNGQGHGIDLICKVAPYPPPPKWITIESKTVMKESFGQHATPRAGKASDYQKDPIGNLNKHLELAENSIKSRKNEYAIDKNTKKLLKELTMDFEVNRTLQKNSNKIIQGFKLTIGLDTKFNVSKNDKYKNMYIFEDITK
ncbi:hypothetical protein [Enterobacter hormaechei]|uniref:hypothetical protein n=1 Tax=Enterobacter hormaechei TaxID=158836 RepID=UPI002932B046|nr:hypothetical protein [Enterobacter hormaechei]MDV2196883.1 hypothetical protein [Enterobacter hormaechei]